MEHYNTLFLQALKASLTNQKVDWTDVEPSDWQSLFRQSDIHHILPMIYEAVFTCPAAMSLPPAFLFPYKRKTMQQVMMQTMKTSEFLQLYKHLRAAGVKPLVVKGIICRNLYPNPDARISGDEDILIPPEQFRQCHEAMLSFGMQVSDPEADIEKAYEVPYGKMGSPLYIELHKSLFPEESDAYGEFNRLFTGVHERAVEVTIDGVEVATMSCTDHLFYLICHAFKHFLHSGFGIRQVCDIILFANTYGKEIDWKHMLKQCKEIHADVFAAALFQIGSRYLTFDPEAAAYPDIWKKIKVDETAMLEDLLSSGIYGDADMSRKHSSNITLNEVASQKKGKKTGNGILSSVFLPAKSLEGRFPYLKKHPYLLPIAWVSRILLYLKETKKSTQNNAIDSIKIGNQRKQLLKQYKIIK